jgi:hypothetical protein
VFLRPLNEIQLLFTFLLLERFLWFGPKDIGSWPF